MAYALKIKKKAQKALDKAPEHVRKKIDEELDRVKESPRDNKKM